MSITEYKLSRKARDFLSEGPVKSFIGGEWVASANGQKRTDFNPGSGEPITECYVMQPSDVDRAVRAADASFRSSGWATMSPEERGVYIYRLAELIERDAATFADLEALDLGCTRPIAANFVRDTVEALRYYTGIAKNINYNTPLSISNCEGREVLKPYGVCAVINPWNAPLFAMLWCAVPALVTGNTVVLKPASFTPLTMTYLTRLVAESGIPAGVVNVVCGSAESAGHALANHPGIKRLALTGSVEAGKYVGAACGGNLVPAKLELGGKGAALIFDDVDIEGTATSLTQIITYNAGQICCAPSRWIIHEKIYDEFVSAAVAKMKAVKVGYMFDPQTEMGPVVDASQRNRILSYIEKGKGEGASVLVGGGKAQVPGYPGGFYVQPTLLAGSMDNIAAQEEIFGPVVYLGRFRNEAEGIELVNGTKYSLGNSVWSADLERCNRVAEQMIGGSSWINTHSFIPFGLRFSGVYGSGMGGGVNSPDVVRDYLRPLAIGRVC